MTALLNRAINTAVSHLIPEDYDFTFVLVPKPKTNPEPLMDIGKRVKELTATFFNTTPEAISAKSNRPEVVLMKKMLCKILRDNTRLTLKQVSELVYLKVDHTNVCNSITVLNKWLKVEDEIRETYTKLNLFVFSNLKLNDNEQVN